MPKIMTNKKIATGGATPYARPQRTGNQFVDNTLPNRVLPSDGVERPPWYHSQGSTDDYVRSAVEELLETQAAHTVQTVNGLKKYSCCYCRQFFPPSALQIEHIVPFSTIALSHSFTASEYKLVTNDVANLTYACGNVTGAGCNQSKRDKQLLTFLSEPAVLATTSVAQFFFDAPWAAWMHVGGTMNYRPPWLNFNNRLALATASSYVKADAAELAKQAKDITPRPPLPMEMCLQDRNRRVIASQSCVTYLRNNGRLPAWLTDQVIKNVVPDLEASQFQKQYTPDQYAAVMAATSAVSATPAIVFETWLSMVATWPRH
jgi:hypothetical protein